MQVFDEPAPKGKSKVEELLISQALHCLEARLWSGLDVLNRSQNVERYFRLQLADEQDEVFGVMFFDNGFHLQKFEKIFYGTINEVQVYPRRIVRKALEHNAAKIILVHNHPSGNCKPSDADVEMTKEMQKILKIIDVDLADHIIVSHQNSYSFVEHRLL